MSRKSDENGKAIAIVIIAFIVISVIISIVKSIISFISEYYIYVSGFVLLILVIVVSAKVYASIEEKRQLKIKENEKNIKIQKYESKPYFKETHKPYDMVYMDRGLRFEMEVYNSLSEHFPNSYIITNLLIPRIGSVNEYSEIDILFLHSTGLYVLELKNYKGYIFGNTSSKNWKVGYSNENGKKTYEFQNPIKQNEKHILDLKKHKNLNFLGHVIFNKTTELDSYIENLSYYNQFRGMVESKKCIYSLEELRSINDFIKSINVYGKIENHIKRIEYNDLNAKKEDK